MALPSSGVIKFSDINIELGVAANTPRKLSDSEVRTLFGVASGRIALRDSYGKANRISVTVTIATALTSNYVLNSDKIPGYLAGKTDVTLIIPNNYYVYSTNTSNNGLTIDALDTGDTVAIINNGYIIGMGGGFGAVNGGTALSINRNVTITNNSYIAGGGGAGGGSAYGGGAGGGQGGATTNAVGGSGGNPGSAGGNGTRTSGATSAGGGGGRILPGVGGAGAPQTGGGGPYGGSNGVVGQGGGAGGGGGAYWTAVPYNYGGGNSGTGGTGGSANNVGGNGASYQSQGGIGAGGGGGGGWGANGGSGKTNNNTPVAGGSGGKAVNLNGYTVTWVATGTRYGAIS